MSTCTAETVQEMAANLFYYVRGKLALVLDRQSVNEGQVIGMLQQGDVVISTNISGAWVMLPEGSYVRHPQMRTSKVKTKRDGWLLVEHGDYGILLAAISFDLVKQWFDEEAFLKVPLIKPVVKSASKAKAKPKAKAVAAKASEPPPEEAPPESLPSASSAEVLPSGPSAESLDSPRGEIAALAEATGGSMPSPAAPAAAEKEEEEPEARAATPKAEGYPASDAKAPPAMAVAEAPAAEAKAAAPAAAAAAAPSPKAPPASPPGMVPSGMVLAGASAVMSPSDLAAAKSLAAAAGALKAGAKAKAKVKSAATAKERLKLESFDEHLMNCRSEHWKVGRKYVWVREDPTTTGITVAVLREGAVLCQGIRDGNPLYSADGGCLRLDQDSRFWSSPEAMRPEYIIPKADLENAFIQIEHKQVGMLVDFVPAATKRGSGAAIMAEQTTEKEKRRLPEPVVSRRMDFSGTDHWVVGQWGAWIHTECSVFGPVEFKMQPNDILVFGPQPLRIRLDSGNWWMHVQEGSQVYRRTEDNVLLMLGAGGLKVHGYVLKEDASRTYLKHVLPEAPGMVVTVVSAFGEPWMASDDDVPLYAERDFHGRTMGVLRKGDVVGVRKMDWRWCELVLNSDVHGQVGAGAKSEVKGLNRALEVKMQESKGPVRERRFAAQMPDRPLSEYRRAFVQTKSSYGANLLERCKGDLEEGCIISKERRKLYADVIGLCHDRIYEDNIISLWEGERSKLPSRKSLEAKLFDRSTTVLHAARGDVLAGGAIIKECTVKAMALTSTTGTLGVGKDLNQPEGYAGQTFVGYIDSAASVPGSHAGSAIWEVVSKMGFVMVACHPILLQSTVDFWMSKGMRRYDVNVHKECEDFRNSLLVLTQGKVKCELVDLVEALPPSHLPLFVWLSTKCQEIQDDIDNMSRVFVPDDPENYF